MRGKALPAFLQTNEFNETSKQNIVKYGNDPILEVRVGRKPIQSERLLQIGTLGEYKDILKRYDHDHLFHLWIEFRTNKHLLILEKNGEGKVEVAVDRMFSNEDVQYKEFQLTQPLTLNKVIENTIRALGDKFFRYDHRNNNCQVFVTYVLHSNHITTNDPTAFRFINQKVTQIFDSMPRFVNHLTKLMTDVDGLVNINVGHGRKDIIKLPNGKLAKVTTGIYKDNPTNRKLKRVGKTYKKYTFIKQSGGYLLDIDETGTPNRPEGYNKEKEVRDVFDNYVDPAMDVVGAIPVVGKWISGIYNVGKTIGTIISDAVKEGDKTRWNVKQRDLPLMEDIVRLQAKYGKNMKWQDHKDELGQDVERVDDYTKVNPEALGENNDEQILNAMKTKKVDVYVPPEAKRDVLAIKSQINNKNRLNKRGMGKLIKILRHK